MNYEKDIMIDETALDIECLNQASLFMQYTIYSAKKAMERDLAKDALDLVRAQLDKSIRINPEQYEIAKITETVVSNAIIEEPQYQTANKKYLEARYEADVAQGAVRAFDQKKSMLEALIKLNGQNYFAGPSIPRNLEEEKLKRQSRVDAGIAKSIKRTK